MSNGPFIRPADGKIHSKAGPRWGRTHAGVDLGEWGWNVRSMYRGTVVSVVRFANNDWRVNVRHNGFITRYIHLRSVSVKVGDRITGDTPAARVIGTVGTAGTGPHVHVEIHPGSVWRGTPSASVSRINALLLGTPTDGSSNPPNRGSSTPAGSSGSSGGSSANNVSGRFLRVTANSRANLRSGPQQSSSVIGTARRGHLLKRDSSRDTRYYYGVGDRWFIHKTVATPVSTPANRELVIGSYPGRAIPVTGVNTYELNRSWQELLARTGITKGTRTRMWQRWLGVKVDGKLGPITTRALQNRLRSRGFNPGAIDGQRGPATRRAEARYLNSRIPHMGSKYPQHYRKNN